MTAESILLLANDFKHSISSVQYLTEVIVTFPRVKFCDHSSSFETIFVVLLLGKSFQFKL